MIWVLLCCAEDALSSFFGEVSGQAHTEARCHLLLTPLEMEAGAALGARWRFFCVFTVTTSGWPFAQPSTSLRDLHVAAGVGQSRGEDDECPFEPASPTPGGSSRASPAAPEVTRALQNLT